MDLINHPGMWLADGPALSLARYEADKGILPLSDAGRLQSEHDELIRRWNEGGPANRPPYLYKPGMPSSPHVKGNALDTPAHRRFVQDSAEYGWVQNLGDSDPVHFIYVEENDQHKGRANSVEAVIEKVRKRMTVAISTPDGTAILIHPGGELAVTGSEGKETDGVPTESRNVGGVIDAVWGKRVPLNQTDVNTVIALNKRMRIQTRLNANAPLK